MLALSAPQVNQAKKDHHTLTDNVFSLRQYPILCVGDWGLGPFSTLGTSPVRHPTPRADVRRSSRRSTIEHFFSARAQDGAMAQQQPLSGGYSVAGAWILDRSRLVIQIYAPSIRGILNLNSVCGLISIHCCTSVTHLETCRSSMIDEIRADRNQHVFAALCVLRVLKVFFELRAWGAIGQHTRV